MKPLFSFTTISLIIFIVACSKKENVQSKTELLTTGTWKLTGSEMDKDFNGTYEVNQYGLIPDCIKDNLFTFKTTSLVILDEGPAKCHPMDPQTETTNWWFTNNETTLFMYGESYDIKELSNTTLRLRPSINAGRRQVTYTKQ